MSKENYRNLFMLEPEIIYLNHGSFGACPKPVFEEYQRWQRELEHHPVEFLDRRLPYLMAEARTVLAEYLGVNSNEVVFFQNPTTAMNMVARSLTRNREPYLNYRDEILTTDHEYGAVERVWRYLCRQSSARYVRQNILLPVTSKETFIEQFWHGVTKHTRVILISHITSPTALNFPVGEICRLARQHGILTVIDGAHAPGQVNLDMHEIGGDIYIGACHKWLCAPKGSAFLFARKEVQHLLDPLVVSWGYDNEHPGENSLIDHHEWQGTRDFAAFLSVPAAIQFQRKHNWDQIRQDCHMLALEFREKFNDHFKLEPISTQDWFHQMVTIRLPPNTDLHLLKYYLVSEKKIELPIFEWNFQKFMRISVQAYNTQEDLIYLLDAITGMNDVLL